jgi:hypothetical protein
MFSIEDVIMTSDGIFKKVRNFHSIDEIFDQVADLTAYPDMQINTLNTLLKIAKGKNALK